MDTQGEDYIAHEIISRAVSIRRFSASEQSKVIEMLKRLEEELLIHLLRKDLTNIGRRNTALILRQAQEIIAEHYSNISDFVDESLPEFARSEAKFIGDTLGKVMIDLEPSLPTETYFRELMKDTLIQGAPSANWWDRQAGDTAFRFANEVRQGMIQGETVDQITKRVQKNVEPLIENNARAQVNTSIQQVAADARRETFKQNDDIIDGIIQISTLDSHTSLTCIAYSGATWENTADHNPIPPTKLPYNGGVPRHWNCRSIEAPIFKTKDGWQLPHGTRASEIGQIDVNTTMADFIKMRGPAFADKLLGVGRAQLFMDGKMTLTQLLDQSGRPLSLKELNELHK